MKGDCPLVDKEKEEHLSKIDSYKDKNNINVTQMAVIFDNTAIQSSFYENTSGNLGG